MEQKIEQTQEFKELRDKIFWHNKMVEVSITVGLGLILLFLPLIMTQIGLGMHTCLNEQLDKSLQPNQRMFNGVDCNSFLARWFDGFFPASGVAFVIAILYFWIKSNMDYANERAKVILEYRRLNRLQTLKGGKQ